MNALVVAIVLLLRDSKIRGNGRISAISMSNTRKITARRKNRRENGMRADLLGSNPHSNGEDFSRSEDDREERIHARRNTRGGRMMPIIEKVRARVISGGLSGKPHF